MEHRDTHPTAPALIPPLGPNGKDVLSVSIRDMEELSSTLCDPLCSYLNLIVPAGHWPFSDGLPATCSVNACIRCWCCCSHQQQAMAPMLLRGDSQQSVKLGALAPYSNQITNPYNIDGIELRLQFDKQNQTGDKLDTKANVDGKHVHACALVSTGIHIMAKLSPPHGKPLQWADIISGIWCVTDSNHVSVISCSC